MVTFSRRGLHGRVVDDLGTRIVSEQIPSGAIIDVEALAQELSVSRTVVREAVKVLTAKGLVDARPRIGTYVLTRRDWNLLDADIMRWRQSNSDDGRLMHELEEVRQMFEPAGARLAAERGTAEQIEAIRAGMTLLDQSVDGSLDEQIAADILFHRSVLEASNNELVARFEVLLEPAMRARDALTLPHDHDKSFLKLHRQVLDCIAARDPDGAAAAMTHLLTSAAADTAQTLLAGPRKTRGGGRKSRATATG